MGGGCPRSWVYLPRALAVGDVHRDFEAEAKIGVFGFGPGHCNLLDGKVELGCVSMKSGLPTALRTSDRIVRGPVRPARWEILQFTLMIFMSFTGGFA
jgi:hypothetical protein